MKMSPLCQLQMTLLGGFPGVLGVTVRLMSDGQLSRPEGLHALDHEHLATRAAAQLLGLEPMSFRTRPAACQLVGAA